MNEDNLNMNRNFKLLTLLRGYNFSNPRFYSTLIGYGKETGDKKEKIYDNARAKVITYFDDESNTEDGVSQWIKYFQNNSVIDEIFSPVNRDLAIEDLIDFIRNVILAQSEDYLQFYQAINEFSEKLMEFAENEIVEMDKWVDKTDDSHELFQDYQYECRDAVKNFVRTWVALYNRKVQDDTSFKRFIMDCLILVSETASDVEMTLVLFNRRLLKLITKDDNGVFSTDLSEYEDEDREDLNKDKPLVKKKERIDVEDGEYEPPFKKERSDVEGSGFYSWWI